ncbi:unnamed protein product [Psylliodes chrysocephalus]|uniref:Uncharacterized protein n=1 Tax=Psylliodes chrysocephalus TaxID=3402493 RepID=A0A9P0GMK0_9CUCU|nr:unnamed protein product [Psylliodes chrysocephala]
MPLLLITKIPSAQYIEDSGSIALRSHEKINFSSLQGIPILDLRTISSVAITIMSSTADLLWLYRKWADLPNIPGWNGFMEEVTVNHLYQKSFIACLPFINAPPTNSDIIFTVLASASEKRQ